MENLQVPPEARFAVPQEASARLVSQQHPKLYYDIFRLLPEDVRKKLKVTITVHSNPGERSNGVSTVTFNRNDREVTFVKNVPQVVGVEFIESLEHCVYTESIEQWNDVSRGYKTINVQRREYPYTIEDDEYKIVLLETIKEFKDKAAQPGTKKGK